MTDILPSQQPPMLPATKEVNSAANAAAIALLGSGNGAAQVPNLDTISESSSISQSKQPDKPHVRPPRRSHSLSEYDDQPPPTRCLHAPTLPSTLASPTSPSTPQIPGLESVMEVSTPTTPPMGNPAPLVVRTAQPKPKKPPRRAFSLMDSEPVVHTHKPSERWSLLDLPTDILFNIFDFLDPIDSVCFGLTSRACYPIHRRLYGRVSLASRRHGPNTLEWAWRNGGHLRHPGLTPPQSPMPRNLPPLELPTSGASAVTASAPTTPAATNMPQSPGFPPMASRSRPQSPASPHRSRINRDAIRRDGQVYCRKCGTSRCELHSHLREWMGPNLEYCSVTRKFGKPAPPGSRDTCYRRSPKNPSFCGRHSPKVRASAPVSPRLRPLA